MENSPIMDRFPILQELDPERQEGFRNYFHTAPDWVLDSCALQELEKGTTFIQEGEPASMVYFIVKGAIKATDYRIYGITYDFRLFCEFYAFGGMEAIIRQDRYQTTLRTVTHCTVIRLPRQVFQRWMDTDIVALRLESQLMGEYLLETSRENRALLFLQGADRMALFLANRYRKCAQGGVLKMSRDRQELSDYTGLCVKTISRCVKKFREEDMITVQGRYLLINPAQFEKLEAMLSEVLVEEF